MVKFSVRKLNVVAAKKDTDTQQVVQDYSSASCLIVGQLGYSSFPYMSPHRAIFPFLLLCATLPVATAQPMPAKAAVLQTMKRANAYFMQTWPNPGQVIVTNKTRPSNIWTRAVYYEGLMALYAIEPQPAYYEYAVYWGQKHQWGLRSGISSRNADDQCCGQTYLDLFQIDNRQQPERIRDIKLSIDAMVNTSKVDDWSWIDALQMAMPVFARLGVDESNPDYLRDNVPGYTGIRKRRRAAKGCTTLLTICGGATKILCRPIRNPMGRTAIGHGAMAGCVAALVRVLDILPANAPHRDEYLKTYLDMMAAIQPLQRTDGFWNVSLHDPTHFGGKELTGTALFVYGMAWGIRQGLLPPQKIPARRS